MGKYAKKVLPELSVVTRQPKRNQEAVVPAEPEEQSEPITGLGLQPIKGSDSTIRRKGLVLKLNRKHCSFCGHSIKNEDWVKHWKRAHFVRLKKQMKTLEAGKCPEEPDWAEPIPGKCRTLREYLASYHMRVGVNASAKIIQPDEVNLAAN